jgi:iron complex outermembrane receptor protein
VQNLFDEYHFMSVSDISRSLGLVTGVPGLPRTWAVSIKKNW